MRELTPHDREVAEFIQSLGIDELTAHLATLIAATAYSGVLEHGETPDRALEITFANFGQGIAEGLEVLRPHYEERCELALFEASVNNDLDDIETISDTDRVANFSE